MDNYIITRINIKINKLKNEINEIRIENKNFYKKINYIIDIIINENNKLKEKCQIYGFKNERLERLLSGLLYKKNLDDLDYLYDSNE